MNENNIDWIHLAQDRDKWRVLAKNAKKRWIQYRHQWRVLRKRQLNVEFHKTRGIVQLTERLQFSNERL